MEKIGEMLHNYICSTIDNNKPFEYLDKGIDNENGFLCNISILNDKYLITFVLSDYGENYIKSYKNNPSDMNEDMIHYLTDKNILNKIKTSKFEYYHNSQFIPIEIFEKDVKCALRKIKIRGII